jgi:hypothetical protein
VYFEKLGKVSIWVGQVLIEPGSDFLTNRFGAEDYDLDFQDCIVEEVATPVLELFEKLSYADSFIQPALEATVKLGIDRALWVTAQYNYDYDPSRCGLSSVPTEPRFVGSFDWHD